MNKKLHKLIDSLNPDLRVSKNREFFVMTPGEAYELLVAIALISGTQDKLKCFKSATPKSSAQTVRKPSINFSQCNIPIGAELVYTEDDTVRVTVVSDRKVQYKNEITSLSAIVKEIKQCSTAAGPSFFTYNGELIPDIAARTQWKN